MTLDEPILQNILGAAGAIFGKHAFGYCILIILGVFMYFSLCLLNASKNFLVGLFYTTIAWLFLGWLVYHTFDLAIL